MAESLRETEARGDRSWIISPQSSPRTQRRSVSRQGAAAQRESKSGSTDCWSNGVPKAQEAIADKIITAESAEDAEKY